MTSASNPYLTLLRSNRDYRNLFSALVVSLLGDWLNLIAVFVLLGEIAGASAEVYAWVIVLKMLPSAILGPLAGVVADTFDRRALMLLSDLLRAMIAILLLLVPLYPSLLLVCTLIFLQSSLSAFFEPARSAILPDLLDKEHLLLAGALGALAWSVCLTAGSALGGVITEFLSWQVAVVCDAGSYLVSAYLVAQLPRKIRSSSDNDVAERRSLRTIPIRQLLGFDRLVEGLRYLKAQPQIASLMTVKSLYSLAGATTLMLTVFGQEVFRMGESGALSVALLFTARGMGAACGPFIARWWVVNDREKMLRLVGVGFIVGAVCYSVVSHAPSIWVAALCIVFSHMAGAVTWTMSTVLIQLEADREQLGRVFGIELMLFDFMLAFATLFYGTLIGNDWLSPRAAALMMALSWLPAAGVWYCLRRRYFGTQNH